MEGRHEEVIFHDKGGWSFQDKAYMYALGRD